MKPTDFAKALSNYLGMYLPGQRNVSTIPSSPIAILFKLFLSTVANNLVIALRISFA